jgi:hypothetical protein
MITTARPWFSRAILGIRAKVIQTAGGVLIIYGERVGNEDGEFKLQLQQMKHC